MKFTLLVLTLLITSLISTTVLATTHLPAQYPLKKVAISISSKSGTANAETYQITIKGDGDSFFTKNNQTKQPLSITTDNLLGLLNDFYAIHFFEIKDTFTVKEKVILKNNKTITTVTNNEPIMSHKRVCIQLRSYKKCVTIIDNQPVAVAQIVSKIESLLQSAPKTGKAQ